jgi:hypothetical protein
MFRNNAAAQKYVLQPEQIVSLVVPFGRVVPTQDAIGISVQRPVLEITHDYFDGDAALLDMEFLRDRPDH